MHCRVSPRMWKLRMEASKRTIDLMLIDNVLVIFEISV